MIYAFFVLLLGALYWMYRQGREIEKIQADRDYYKQALVDEMEERQAVQFVNNTVEAENRKYADKIKKFEAALAHLEPGSDWQLRDSPASPETDTNTDSSGDKKSED